MTHTQKMQEEARDELRKKFCPDGAWDTFNMTFEIEKHIDTLVARVVRETEEACEKSIKDALKETATKRDGSECTNIIIHIV